MDVLWKKVKNGKSKKDKGRKKKKKKKSRKGRVPLDIQNSCTSIHRLELMVNDITTLNI